MVKRCPECNAVVSQPYVKCKMCNYVPPYEVLQRKTFSKWCSADDFDNIVNVWMRRNKVSDIFRISKESRGSNAGRFEFFVTVWYFKTITSKKKKKVEEQSFRKLDKLEVEA